MQASVAIFGRDSAAHQVTVSVRARYGDVTRLHEYTTITRTPFIYANDSEADPSRSMIAVCVRYKGARYPLRWNKLYGYHILYVEFKK